MTNIERRALDLMPCKPAVILGELGDRTGRVTIQRLIEGQLAFYDDRRVLQRLDQDNLIKAEVYRNGIQWAAQTIVDLRKRLEAVEGK